MSDNIIKEKPLTVKQIAEHLRWSDRQVKKLLAVVITNFREETLPYITEGKTDSGQNAKLYYPQIIDFILEAHKSGLTRNPSEKRVIKLKTSKKKPKPKLVPTKKTPRQIQETGGSQLEFAKPSEKARQRLGEYIMQKNQEFFSGDISWDDVFDLLEAGCDLIETAAYLRVKPEALAQECQDKYKISFLDLSQVLYNSGLAKIRLAMQKNVTGDNPNPIIIAMVAKQRVPEKSNMLSSSGNDIVMIGGKLIDLNEYSDEEIEELEAKLLMEEAKKNDKSDNSTGITEAEIVQEEEEDQKTE